MNDIFTLIALYAYDVFCEHRTLLSLEKSAIYFQT